MSETPRTPARWSITSLAISTVVGLALGLSAGAAADRAVSSVLGPSGEFAVGITTAILVSSGLLILSYRWLTRESASTVQRDSGQSERPPEN
jgi:hypothetical protein